MFIPLSKKQQWHRFPPLDLHAGDYTCFRVLLDVDHYNLRCIAAQQPIVGLSAAFKLPLEVRDVPDLGPEN
jgi:hypothetical protein